MSTEQRRGECIVYSASALWSLFPIVTVLTVSILPSLFAAAASTAVAAVFFGALLTYRRRWSQMRVRGAWKNILLATFFIGIVFYGLLFTGYRFTTPGNGAVMGLMEIFFTFLIVNVLWRHEPFIPSHAAGGVLMLLGAFLVALSGWSGRLNPGDLLILIATASAPIGNIYAQRARRVVSSDMIMFIRSILSSFFLFILAFLFEPLPGLSTLHASFWFLLLNGVLFLGLSKFLWIEAMHRMSIAKTLVLSKVKVLFTLLFAYLLLGQPVTPSQMLAFIPMAAGTWLLTRRQTRKDLP